MIIKQVSDGLARRYNEGKLEISLVPTELIEGVARVMTYGKEKYTVRDDLGKVISSGADNWRSGLPWMDVLSSMERHILAFKKGEDRDLESTLLHLEHAGANLAFLLNYYKTHPELDNRPHLWISKPRIALDLDDVCNYYVEEYCGLFGLEIPCNWCFDDKMMERIHKMEAEGSYDEFLLNIPEKIKPEDVPHNVVAYVTARQKRHSGVTEQWLKDKGFPNLPVYYTSGESKIPILKELKIDIMIDDNIRTAQECGQNGICCYLWDAPHNQNFQTGYRRIKSLKEISC